MKQACYVIGDGASINVWKGPWVPGLHKFKPKPKFKSLAQTPLVVSQPIDHDLHVWRANIVLDTFTTVCPCRPYHPTFC